MKKHKIYLSGPVTGTDDYMKKFLKLDQELVEAGFTVVNPAVVNFNLPEDTTHEEYMKMSLVMLEMCDAVIMMEGYEKSRGCNMELCHAIEHKKMILFEEGMGR